MEASEVHSVPLSDDGLNGSSPQSDQNKMLVTQLWASFSPSSRPPLTHHQAEPLGGPPENRLALGDTSSDLPRPHPTLCPIAPNPSPTAFSTSPYKGKKTPVWLNPDMLAGVMVTHLSIATVPSLRPTPTILLPNESLLTKYEFVFHLATDLKPRSHRSDGQVRAGFPPSCRCTRFHKVPPVQGHGTNRD